jgi:hypothetical protein
MADDEVESTQQELPIGETPQEFEAREIEPEIEPEAAPPEEESGEEPKSDA